MLDGVAVRAKRDQPHDLLARRPALLVVLVALVDLDRVRFPTPPQISQRLPAASQTR
jgi:hypothetical protein